MTAAVMRLLTALSLFLLLALGVDDAMLRAQEPDPVDPPEVVEGEIPPGPPCRTCSRRGVKECSGHGRGLLELEQSPTTVQCSFAAECRKCGGALVVDCNRCEHELAEQAAAARRELAQEWLAARKARFDKMVDEPSEVGYLRTPHAELVFSLGPLTVGRSKMGTHELMHLYGQRIEDLRQRFVEVFELREDEFPPEPETPPEANDENTADPRLRIHMFAELKDQNAVAPQVTGIGTRGPSVKLMGTTLVWSMGHDKKLMRGDEDVWRSMVHNLSHLLMSGAEPVAWIGNRAHGWVDEGVAHWFEYHLVDERCANFCFEEVGVAPGSNWKNGEWKLGIRQIAEQGALMSFVDLMDKNSDQLDMIAHAHAFAWVDFLIATQGGRKFADFLQRLKKQEATRDAMQATFGFGPLQFDERFSTWVKETYPLQKGR